MAEELILHREYTLTYVYGMQYRFGTKIRATHETIHEVVQARNMGEVQVQYVSRPMVRSPSKEPLADPIEDDGLTVEALYVACFVGFMALKSGGATVKSVLGDGGLILETVHNIAFDED